MDQLPLAPHWWRSRVALGLAVLLWCGRSQEDQCLLDDKGQDRQNHRSLLQSAPIRRLSHAGAKVSKSLVESSKEVREQSFVEMGSSSTLDSTIDSVARAMEDKFMSKIFGNQSIAELAGQEVCGTRPLFPQLQLELEVYRRLGFVDAKYARCRVPSIRSLALKMPMGKSVTSGADALYTVFDQLTQTKYHELTERRALAAQCMAVVFCALVMLSLFGLASNLRGGSPKAADDENQANEDGRMLRLAWIRGSSSWVGVSLDWLEPVIKRYGWSSGDMAKAQVQEKIEDGTSSQYEAYTALREAWREEVAYHGLENASLLRSIRRFLGAGAISWLLFCAGIAAFLEHHIDGAESRVSIS